MVPVRGAYSSTLMGVNNMWGNARFLFGPRSIFTVLYDFIIDLFKEYSVLALVIDNESKIKN